MKSNHTSTLRSARIFDGKKQLRASIVFAHLQPGPTWVLSGKRLVWGPLVDVSTLRLDSGELLTDRREQKIN